MPDYDPATLFTASQCPRQNPAFEPRDAFDMYVAHVWELCDGLTTVDQILDLSRLDINRTVGILGALRMSGALILPGEAPGDVHVSEWPDVVVSRDEPGAIDDLPRVSESRPTHRFARGSDPPPLGSDDSEGVEGLFDQACVYETRGNYEDALRLFDVVVRESPSAEYLRRAATCALGAWELELAEAWVLEAVEVDSIDPMTLRVLADVYLAQQRYERAEVVLNRAIELASPHGQLVAAMRTDLAHVRRLLARSR
jgi:tetratricopeptide (TPR) repeat protein